MKFGELLWQLALNIQEQFTSLKEALVRIVRGLRD